MFIYFFGEGQADGGTDVKHLVGGKGASLADMTRAGLNVPPGFTISTECCDLYYKAGKTWPAGLEDEVRANLGRLEKLTGRSFGHGGDPLLVAVRSGAAQSMPGMMDTLLNVGLNPDCVRAMAERTSNRRGAWEAYRHFLVMFGHTVAGLDEAVFTGEISGLLQETAQRTEAELDADQMEALCRRFLDAYRRHRAKRGLTPSPKGSDPFSLSEGQEMPTDPWQMLCAAINAVFGSWNNERAITYRQHHRIEGLLGTAVNVQMMCPSEVSGVMFTANPVNPALEQVLIESSYGLGEAIVLGKVTPDRFALDRHNLNIVERAISHKETVIATLARDGKGQTGARDAASLTDAQLIDLARLGLRVEEYFQRPSDIEWALSDGRFYLLQARAIKGLTQAPTLAGLLDESYPSLSLRNNPEAQREHVRLEERAALRARAEPTGTVWSRYNSSEILPEPTPMTWAIVRRFMSGRGGFGLMYRDLGFDPDPALDEEGIYDLVCGRPYCNLSREPRMQFRLLPFEHPFAALKAAPQKALYPQPVFNPARAGWRFWVFLPAIFVKLVMSAGKVQRLCSTFATDFRERIVTKFAAETERAAAQDLSALETPALLTRLEGWIQRTLHDFARDSLKPTALAAVAMGGLERLLLKPLGPERVRAALGEMTMGVRPDPEADLPGAVRDLAGGRLDRAAFLTRFGHRSSQEMELAHPRWAEDPAALDRVIGQSHAPATTRGQTPSPKGSDPLSSPPGPEAKPESTDITAVTQRIATEAQLNDRQRAQLQTDLQTLHTYLGLRETAKHYLMKGYALIRRILVELDQRYQLEGGIFYLKPEELPRLQAGEDLRGLIAERRRRREVALTLEVPQVLFSDDLDAIGRAMEIAGADTLQGVALSAGVAEAPAWVLEEPGSTEVPPEGYILVCPSTDPAWVPLFIHARGLVMETGGVLSHGAIVAHEFGLPAVAGIAAVHRRLRTGQRLRVDGSSGKVTVLPS